MKKPADPAEARRNRDSQRLCEAWLKSMSSTQCRYAATVIERGRLLCGVHATKRIIPPAAKLTPTIRRRALNDILRVPIPKRIGGFTVVEVLAIGSPSQLATRAFKNADLAATIMTRRRHVLTIVLATIGTSPEPHWEILQLTPARPI